MAEPSVEARSELPNLPTTTPKSALGPKRQAMSQAEAYSTGSPESGFGGIRVPLFLLNERGRAQLTDGPMRIL
jgi:hypothetical protein